VPGGAGGISTLCHVRILPVARSTTRMAAPSASPPAQTFPGPTKFPSAALNAMREPSGETAIGPTIPETGGPTTVRRPARPCSLTANLKNRVSCAAGEMPPARAWTGQLLALNAAAKKVRSSAVAEIPPVSSQPAGNGTTAVIQNEQNTRRSELAAIGGWARCVMACRNRLDGHRSRSRGSAGDRWLAGAGSWRPPDWHGLGSCEELVHEFGAGGDDGA